MAQKDMSTLRKEWDQWFSDVDVHIRANAFSQWERIKSSTDSLHTILENTEFDFSQALYAVEKAERTLEFRRPYQIVVIGESGAGKSTLINALIEQPILVTGVGGAVTGVATYIYPNAMAPGEEFVKVLYRSEEQFQQLLDRVERTNKTSLANGNAHDLDPIAEGKTNQTLNDIQSSWETVKRLGLEGKSSTFHPTRDRSALEMLMEEHSVQNVEGSSDRVIAGIQQIEYHLAGTSSALKNCVIIDTPGLGARTIRHEEILKIEVEQADAVILVVNARRPELQADKAAELMRDILFAGYSEEQQITFSSKIFLVVNQFDVIKSDQDRRRLDISIKAIASVISSDYLARYGQASGNIRYFEMVATDRKRVDYLRSQVDDFLSRNRLELMLREAEVQNYQAYVKAKAVCAAVLHNLQFNASKMSPDALETNLTNQVCLERLEKDRKSLLNTLRQVYERLSKHLDSQQHEQRLRDIITKIRQSAKEKIAETLPDLLQNLDVKTVDDVTLFEVGDTAENTLLLKLQSAIRNRLESEMEQQFALYYIGLFETEVQSVKLYSQIEAKTYGQSYILEGLNPVSELEQVQMRIRSDYIAACRQILVYELIQMPIIESLQRVESKAWSIIKGLDLFSDQSAITQEAPPKFTPSGPQSNRFGNDWRKQITAASKQMLKTTFGLGEEEKDKDIDLSAEKLRDKYFLDKLRETLGSGNKSQRDLAQINALLTSQFEQRIDSALIKTLPHLESVFLYALGTFRKRHDDLVLEMKQAHMLHVNDSQVSIKHILINQDNFTIARLTRAATILSNLEKLHLAP